ncbi:low molecular weight protein-tyrosine-phosphatase [Billgrantia montanilacus]|uniref:protein-tyrosine-phosphatase n=1 Tax=Billgrantia montanilacus TaxID=2282305 RepID=A0A368U1L1_9GAMM|nr:low molecular weight protein-tyrosine-phosphatase [Halomonas montanilacus]RCV91019.1 low molecular weight phosphotyrosine protein phosphatase [Halomonas montanilacus]
MFQRILVVCTGNICRSPVAEVMLQQRLPHLTVTSAGLGALIGQPVDAQARRLAEANRLDVSSHLARQLDADLLAEADLVLVMTDGQRQAVAKRWPEVRGKILLMGKWLAQQEGIDIPDPYRKSPEVFEHVHRLLDEATRLWAERL